MTARSFVIPVSSCSIIRVKFADTNFRYLNNAFSELHTVQLVKVEVVAEIEGEYGPLTISERMVQKIWAKGDFRKSDLKTLEGAHLEILDLGQWNLLAGPDFKQIAIKVNGKVIHGDGELHFFDSDWETHNHESDPAFKNVILHILVFPPKIRKRSIRCSVEHTLLFLDLLPQGLESYAEEEALGALISGDETALEESLLELGFDDRMALLVESAAKRWKAKVDYAKRRIETLGWEEACHQTALEIMGYRYNRAAMLFLAGDYSLSALRSGNFSAADLYQAGHGRWRTSGTRPANHPRQRLFQYEDWINQRPLWPSDLEDSLRDFPQVPDSELIKTTRKTLALGKIRSLLAEKVVGGAVGGTRIENLICDGFLPLVAARSGRELFSYWYHWFPGDIPSALKRLFQLVNKGSPRRHALCNGALQGALQRMIEVRAPKRRK